MASAWGNVATRSARSRVEQPSFVLARPLVVAGDGPELAGQVTVGDERAQRDEPVESQHAGDAGVLGVVLLLRRTAPPGDEIRVDGHDDVARIEQPFDERPVARLDRHPDLGRIGLQAADAVDERLDGVGAMLDPDDLHDTLVRPPERHQVELLRPVDAYSEHGSSSRTRGEADAASGEVEARRRPDGPVLEGQHPCWRQASEAVLPGRSLIAVLVGQGKLAFPEGDLCAGW
jgi:hypothetical protein